MGGIPPGFLAVLLWKTPSSQYEVCIGTISLPCLWLICTPPTCLLCPYDKKHHEKSEPHVASWSRHVILLGSDPLAVDPSHYVSLSQVSASRSPNQSEEHAKATCADHPWNRPWFQKYWQKVCPRCPWHCVFLHSPAASKITWPQTPSQHSLNSDYKPFSPVGGSRTFTKQLGRTCHLCGGQAGLIALLLPLCGMTAGFTLSVSLAQWARKWQISSLESSHTLILHPVPLDAFMGFLGLSFGYHPNEQISRTLCCKSETLYLFNNCSFAPAPSPW